MKTQEKKGNIFKFFGKIADYVVFPIILVSFLSVFIIYLSTPKNQVPSIFGYSMVKVLTSSMVEANFNPGDVVFINQKHKEIEKGDIVAFYKYEDTKDKTQYSNYSSLVLLENFEGEVVSEVNTTGRITRERLANNKSPVYFHYVDEIFVSPDGVVFYATKGSNPGASRDGYIRQDYIVGKHVKTPIVINFMLTFTTSTAGLIVLVVFPLALLVLLECFNLINKINVILIEERFFKREIDYDDPLVKKFAISNYMSLPRKAYYYITSKEKDRPFVFDLFYGSGYTNFKKHPDLKNDALIAVKTLSAKGYAQYFLFWQDKCKNNYDKKDTLKLKTQFEKETFSSGEKQKNNKEKKV